MRVCDDLWIHVCVAFLCVINDMQVFTPCTIGRKREQISPDLTLCLRPRNAPLGHVSGVLWAKWGNIKRCASTASSRISAIVKCNQGLIDKFWVYHRTIQVTVAVVDFSRQSPFWFATGRISSQFQRRPFPSFLKREQILHDVMTSSFEAQQVWVIAFFDVREEVKAWGGQSRWAWWITACWLRLSPIQMILILNNHKWQYKYCS